MNEKGFTLIEIIISVAALSILSIFLMKLFIQGNNFNIKAYELDQSVVMTQNILELIEQQEEPLLSSNELYRFNWEKVGTGYNTTLYLNERFEAMDSKGGAAYILNIHVESLDEVVENQNLFQYTFEVLRMKTLPMEEAFQNSVYNLTATKLLNSWGQ